MSPRMELKTTPSGGVVSWIILIGWFSSSHILIVQSSDADKKQFSLSLQLKLVIVLVWAISQHWLKQAERDMYNNKELEMEGEGEGEGGEGRREEEGRRRGKGKEGEEREGEGEGGGGEGGGGGRRGREVLHQHTCRNGQQ